MRIAHRVLLIADLLVIVFIIVTSMFLSASLRDLIIVIVVVSILGILGIQSARQRPSSAPAAGVRLVIVVGIAFYYLSLDPISTLWFIAVSAGHLALALIRNPNRVRSGRRSL